MESQTSNPTPDELRKKFKLQFADNIASNTYHERDLERLEEEDGLCRRFLLHQKQSLEKAAAMVDSSFRWRKEIGVNDCTERSFPREFHELGSIYFHNVDKDGHKILHFQVSKHKKDPDKIFQQKQFIAWWIDKHFQKTPDDPIVVMFDMQGAGISNMDLDLVRFQISCFATYYPALLAYMLIYEMPWVLNAVWKLIKQLLSEEQQKFVHFAKKHDVDKHISREQLLLHMGGTDPYQYQYLPTDDSGIDVNLHTPEEPMKTLLSDESPTEPLPPTNGVRRRVKFADKQQTYASIDAGDAAADDGSEKSLSCTPPSTTALPISNGKIRSQMTPNPIIPKDASDRPVHKGSIMDISPAYSFTFKVTDETQETVDYMTIYNVTDKPMAYKVKTTNPDNYRVRTSSGVIQERGSTNVFVFLQPGVTDVSKDKFLVMGLLVDDLHAKGPQLSQLWKTSPKDHNTFCDHKLWCTISNNDREPQSDTDRILDEVEKVHSKGRHVRYNPPNTPHDTSDDQSYDNYEPRRRRKRRQRPERGSTRNTDNEPKSSSNQDYRHGGDRGYDRDHKSKHKKKPHRGTSPAYPVSIRIRHESRNPLERMVQKLVGYKPLIKNGEKPVEEKPVLDRMLLKQEAIERRIGVLTKTLGFVALILFVITFMVVVEVVTDSYGVSSSCPVTTSIKAPTK